jgi:hypothetical protein
MSSNLNSIQDNVKFFVDNILSYENSVYEKDFIINYPSAKLYLIGDLEGDYHMIFRWFLDKKLIDDQLNWIADENIYVIQTGDQLDMYNVPTKNVKNNLYNHPYRRNRNRIGQSIFDFVKFDFQIVLLFEILKMLSFKKYGTPKVYSVLGNHELLNLEMALHHAILYPRNNYELENFDNITKQRKFIIKHPIINLILSKRPIIIKFNNFIISHGGISPKIVTEYMNFTNKKVFDIDQFILSINHEYFNSGIFNEFFKNISYPILWNRENSEKNDSYTILDHVSVIGHNTYSNVLYCNNSKEIYGRYIYEDEEKKGLCNSLDYLKKDYKNNFGVEPNDFTTTFSKDIKMIKVDSGITSRMCFDGITYIKTGLVEFKDLSINEFNTEIYKFICDKNYNTIDLINYIMKI